MHCGSCIRRVSQALASTKGLKVKEVRVGAARLSSAQNPAPMSESGFGRSGQGRLPGATGRLGDRARHRIDYPPGAGHDLRFLPAPRRRGSAFGCRSPIRSRRSDGQSRQRRLRSCQPQRPRSPDRGHSRGRLRRCASPRRCFRRAVFNRRCNRNFEPQGRPGSTLAAGAAAMLLAMPLDSEMGPLDHA
jgi:hypothetical protein